MTGKPEFVDVLVIGAGLAGIGSACQLRRNMPQLSLAILEARPGKRRHLGPVPLSGHSFRQRYVHLQLWLQALDC